MTASAARILPGIRLTALVLSTFAVLVLSVGAPADDGVPQQERDLEKIFLERVADAKRFEASGQIEELKKRAEKGAGGPAAADDAPQARREAEQRAFGARLVKKGIVPAGQARALMVFRDGGIDVFVEAITIAVEPDDNFVLPGDPPLAAQQFRIADASCEQMVYGKGRNEAEARRHLDMRLAQRIAAIHQACQLTDSQSQKLKLAGRGDIHRLFEQVCGMQLKIATAGEVAGGDQRELMNQVLTLSREARALRCLVEGGPFGKDSLFAKARTKILTPAQTTRLSRGESLSAPAN